MLSATMDGGALMRLMLFGAAEAAGDSNANPNTLAAAPGMLSAMLLFALASIPTLLALWFAPALVVFQDQPAARALALSLRAALANPGPIIVYWIAVLLIAFAAAGHQAWSANLFTLVSDVFPKKATASVTGIGGMVGALAGLAADFSLGKVLTSSGPSGYFFAFMIAGSCYLLLLGLAHLLMPKMTPLDENLRHVES
jgi:ACS family hexuronate transporter-like MFS transporter